MATKKTATEVVQEKSEKLLDGFSAWTAFYRENPQRFATEILHIPLRLFQKILLYAMVHNEHFIFIAARGLGKTFLTAIFCVIRCILWPGTKIIIVSGTKGQALEVILKVKDELCNRFSWGSDFLRNEIKEINDSTNKGEIMFKNGSWMKIRTANDNARSARANLIVVDEFRMVPKLIIDLVLKRFLSDPRQPLYLNKKEYKNIEELKEANREIYMSSAWYQSHWSFTKVKTYVANMLSGGSYFCCSLPYQLSIKENLLKRSSIEDEMSEIDFDQTIFNMEMGSLFFSDAEGSFFKYSEIDKQRKIKQSFYPLDCYRLKGLTPPKLILGEERILSVDVALMSSKRNSNDASSLIINSAIPINDTEYMSNIVFMENYEGLTGDDLALIIARTFYEFHCTQLVIDCNGVGMSVYDNLIKDQFDASTGQTYRAFTCCNDEEMASRCKVKDANKCLWSIKASASFNNEMCILLRSGFQNGRINLLVNEYEGKEYVESKISGFKKLNGKQQASFLIAYTQTTYLINELINLEYEVKNGNIRVFEKPGARKDRYSSLGYNYWVLQQISRKRRPKVSGDDDLVNMLFSACRMPKFQKKI